MNTPLNATTSGAAPSSTVPESHAGSPPLAPAAVSAVRLMYWSMRRELWESRYIYLALLAVAAISLGGVLINMINLRRHGGAFAWRMSHASTPYEMVATVIMGTAFLVGIFYTVEALYGERRDRSILFWKSLPVSDVTVVLSKLAIPLVVLPLLSFAITVVTQFAMLLLSSLLLIGSGVDVSTLWTQSSFIHVSLTLLYHIVTVHGLWYAPFYGWLLLVSAAAPRAPFVWAFLPPFVIGVVENLTFNTSHFASMLLHRLMGPENPKAPASSMMDQMAAMKFGQFLLEPGLWIGLAITAVFLFAAVRMRRYRGPI
jgi:ABC-2 type transport system permease protein